MSTLDQNIVTTIWGTAALFGILVSLMVPQAEQRYQDFLTRGTESAYSQARRWIRYTRVLPFAIAVLLVPLTLFAIVPTNRITVAWPPGRDFLLVSSGVIVLVVFGVAVVAITRRLPPFDLGVVADRAERECRSATTTAETRILFINERDEPLVAQWLDWDGERSVEHRYDLPRGQPISIATYVDHYFVVVPADDPDDRIAIVRARSVPSRVRLRDPGGR